MLASDGVSVVVGGAPIVAGGAPLCNSRPRRRPDSTRERVIASPRRAADGQHVLAVLSVVATVSGLTAGCLPSLQVVKMWRERSAEGMSLPWLLGALTNSAIWNCYSILLGNMALILPNALNLAMNVSLTTSVLVLRHRARAAKPVPAPMARVAKAVVDDPELA